MAHSSRHFLAGHTHTHTHTHTCTLAGSGLLPAEDPSLRAGSVNLFREVDNEAKEIQ
jgi:hypothetical protein